MNSLIAANLSCLRQGVDLLRHLPRGIYSHSCPDVFNSSIGGHFRHNIDHYLAFVDGYANGEIDYDARNREPRMETDMGAAAEAMERVAVFFGTLRDADLDRALRIRMDDGGDSTWSSTTLRRELQFLLSHTIHHYALVVTIASRQGITEFPPGFGVAPSTIHYHERLGA